MNLVFQWDIVGASSYRALKTTGRRCSSMVQVIEIPILPFFSFVMYPTVFLPFQCGLT